MIFSKKILENVYKWGLKFLKLSKFETLKTDFSPKEFEIDIDSAFENDAGGLTQCSVPNSDPHFFGPQIRICQP